MGLFRQLENHPRYLQSNPLSSVVVERKVPYFVQVQLEIDPCDYLVSFHYRVKKDCPDLALFEAIAHLITGQSIDEAEKIGFCELDQFFGEDRDYIAYRDDENRSFLNIPLQVFYHALVTYKGQNIFQRDSSPLICRCFGVYEQDIVNYIDSIDNQERVDLKKINGNLYAGSGCTRCNKDIREYLAAITIKRDLKKSGLCGRAGQVVEIYRAFCRWRPSSKMDMEIIDLTPTVATVSPKGEEFSQEELKNFEEWLRINNCMPPLLVEFSR